MTKQIERPGMLLPSIEDITRRDFLVGGAAAFLLGGCGSGENGSEPSGETRGFVDATGEEIQVPVRPERIVATHDINAGTQVLAFGGPLIGIASREEGAREDLVRYFDLDGMQDVGAVYEPNIEQIAALEPDLIVHEASEGELTLDDDVVSRLREIAPVVGIDTFRPVDEVMSDYDELLGDAATASVEDQRSEFQSLLDELRGLFCDRWSEVKASHISPELGELAAYGPTALVPNDILTRVGVSWVPIMEEAGREESGAVRGISLERLPEFSADLILTQTAIGDEILDEPLYQRLPAVRSGQVVELDELFYGAHYPNYIWVAEDLLAQLRELGDLETLI